MRRIIFQPKAYEQFTDWASEDKKIFDKIYVLIAETAREPFRGVGKPEPLKHQFKGCWSRRITKEHRLVYKVTNDSVIVVSCKYHY